MKTYRAFSLLIIAGLAISQPVWASSAEPAKSAAATTGKSADSTNAASSFESNNYMLRKTDVIYVNVVDDSKASGEFKIDIDGNVLLPYLPDHPVNLLGKSTAEAAKVIIDTYVAQGIFIKPSITVAVKVAAPRYIIFLGQVLKQGKIEIPVSKAMNLSTALAEAGGPTSKADRYVTINRINPDGTTKTLSKVDLVAAVKEGKDVALQEGDTITLGESVLGDVWH